MDLGCTRIQLQISHVGVFKLKEIESEHHGHATVARFLRKSILKPMLTFIEAYFFLMYGYKSGYVQEVIWH